MRKFGLEIEVGTLHSADELVEMLAEAGITCINSAYTHQGNSMTDWMLKSDGSLGGLRDAEGRSLSGYEFVSPPLDFDDPDQRGQVDVVASVLERTCTPVPQGGIHVHIEAVNDDGSQMTGRQIGSVVRFFHKFEDAIYRIASSGWAELRPGARTYAKSIPEEAVQAICKARTNADVRAVWDGNYSTNGRSMWTSASLDRYFAVNLRSYFMRNTIEFRCFNSTVNGKRMQAYIALSMAMVQDARHGHARYTKKNYPLGSMYSGAVTEQALMLRLQQVLRSAGRDTHVLMSEADWKNLRKTCWRDSVPQRNIFGRAA